VSVAGDLLVVLGSATPPGRFRGALDKAVARAGAGARLVDLAELELGFAGGADAGEEAVRIGEAVSAAGSVVFATPVYRGSMTGMLKNLFDLLPVSALEGKAVGLAAMGASDHHFLGPDRHLRDVLAFFGAFVAPVSVYLTSADFAAGAPSQQAADALDELLAGTVAISRALDGVTTGPRPLAARAAPG
jgi:FMN reductase